MQPCKSLLYTSLTLLQCCIRRRQPSESTMHICGRAMHICKSVMQAYRSVMYPCKSLMYPCKNMM